MAARRHGLTIVTGANSSHAACLANLLRSLTLSRVRARTLVYDLGLTRAEALLTLAQPAVSEVRRFDFARYPPHVNIAVAKGQYAWKPIIVADVLQELGGLVLWLDAGDLVFGDLRPVKQLLRKSGVYTPTSSGDIRTWTHPETLRSLAATPDLLDRRNRNGAIVGFDAASPGVVDLVENWRACALDPQCIAPPGSDRSNHRQDQAVLSVLVYQHQARHGVELVDQRLQIATHNDHVPSELLEQRLAELREPRQAAHARVTAEERPRVAFIGPGQIPMPPVGYGAVERAIWNLHRDHERHGFDSIVVNTLDPLEISKLCWLFRPNLLHVHFEEAFVACEPYLRARPTPVVVTSHRAALHRTLPEDTLAVARRAAAVIALSPSIRERYLSAGVERVHYIPNGVDTRVFKPLRKRPRSVAAVAYNAPRKRLPEIAEIFLARPDYRLTICGPNTDCADGSFPLIPTGPNVRVLGEQTQEEVARLLGASEFFVHLCEREACSLVVREAMAAGCRVWTAPYNAQDLQNVATSWPAAVEDEGLGERAAIEARERFDWSIIADRTVEVYREALSEARRQPSPRR